MIKKRSELLVITEVKRLIDENYIDSTLYNFPNKLYYIKQN